MSTHTSLSNSGENYRVATTSGPAAGTTTAIVHQQQQQQQQRPRVKRARQPQNHRLFSLGPMRFWCSSQNANLLDILIDWTSWFVEGFIYMIGPLLILLALGIITLLAHTFFTILLPMMQQKYAHHSWQWLILSAHIAWVVFLIVNILYNYAFCVIRKHTGAAYDQVVRELATATAFAYPETPQEVAAFRRDYQDRMVLRMQRRHARYEEQQQQQQQQQSLDVDTTAATMTHRRHNPSPKSHTTPGVTAPPPLRHWMLMGPFEWGFCGTSNQPKPPRSHYDHVTKCLVLNLDHYCPWVFNAVGYFNYRYFVTFLIYVFVGMSYGAMIMLEPFMNLNGDLYRKQLSLQRRAAKEGLTLPERIQPMIPFREEKMTLSLSFMICVAVGIAILIIGGFHIYLACTAQTTIEFHANWNSRRRARAMGQKWKNPYCKGSWKANWQQIFGGRPLLFSILPSSREPEYLPVPVPGHNGLRSEIQKKINADELEESETREAGNVV